MSNSARPIDISTDYYSNFLVVVERTVIARWFAPWPMCLNRVTDRLIFMWEPFKIFSLKKILKVS